MLTTIAAALADREAAPIFKVAIDGVDGVGKTTFANLLADELRSAGRTVIRSSVDSFHNPRSIRYRRGRTPESFFRDSYDYEGLQRSLLDPLSDGGSLRYRSAIFDHTTDSPVEAPEQVAAAGSMLIFDGLFLQRPQLRKYWQFSVFLKAPFDITVPRGAARGPGFGDADPLAQSNQRYVEGNKIYFAEVAPETHATVVIDYADFSQPRIVDWKGKRP